MRQIAYVRYRIWEPGVRPHASGEIRRLVKGENITARTEESDFNPGNAIRPQSVTGRREEPSAGLIGRARSAAEDLVYARHIVYGWRGIKGTPLLPIERSRMWDTCVVFDIIILNTGTKRRRRKIRPANRRSGIPAIGLKTWVDQKIDGLSRTGGQHQACDQSQDWKDCGCAFCS